MNDGIYPVTVPKWGIEMQEGTIVDWHAAEGDEIRRGEELIDIETDKIVNTMEAPSDGVLRRRLVDKGETLQVGALLGIIAPADLADSAIDEFISGFKPAEDASRGDAGAAAAAGPAAEAAPQPPPPAAGQGERAGRRVRVSPAAAQRARELGVDISQVTTAGRRISPADVERYARTQQAAEPADAGGPAYEAQPMSATRKSIARRLAEAKRQIPHFYLSMDVEMDAALERREALNSQGGRKVSVNDLVLRAAVLALQAVPDVNIHVVQDEIRRFGKVSLAVAVATDRGIITPVVHGADALTLDQLAQQAAKLGDKARDASLTREELDGGTFTVSNLGMYGIDEFQAIINPPQGAILALGVCKERIVPGAGDAVRKASVMRATLSSDHRAIDGALGARFLSEFRSALEKPVDL